MLYLAKDLQYITKSDFDDLFAKTDEIGRILNGLIKSLKTKTNYQVKEQSSVDSEQWSGNSLQSTVDSEQSSVDSEQSSVDSEQSSVDSF
jgi:hypothetical protein